MELTEGQQEESPENVVEAAVGKKKRKNPFNDAKRKEEKENRQKKRARIIVRNISYKATAETLRKHFEKYGKIEDVNLLKRADGKLVGCAFIQYETVNQATKAILKATNQAFLGRPVYVDWALGKDEYLRKKEGGNDEPDEKKPKLEVSEEMEIKSESDSESDNDENETTSVKSEDDDEEEDDGEDEDYVEDEDENGESDDETNDNVDAASDSDDDKKDLETKKFFEEMVNKKHISNDVTEGCTVFMKNVPFDAEDADLRKTCRKFGPVYYAIINRDKISGHSKGTGFVKFKTKESADLCLSAGTEFTLLNQVLDPHPALSRDEIRTQTAEKTKTDKKTDSRNLYLIREGLIMTGSKAAEGVSAADMAKRHKLEQIKTQVLKNLSRFVSRNRLSIHNLPLNYDDDKLKKMIISYTGYKPHECRVMRERKITAEHPNGKSKGFGFMSFNTHQEAVTSLRKLNNNPKIFGNIHRPIVAFSIEDRAVHKIKEKRQEKSKLNNPTYQLKLEKIKEKKKQKKANKTQRPNGTQTDDKAKLKKHIKQLEESRTEKKAKAANKAKNQKPTDEFEDYVGMAAKPGTSINMRSTKKINEQAKEHKKRVSEVKRKEKQRKIKQMHRAEKQQIDHPKKKSPKIVDRDNLSSLVDKYKQMIDTKESALSADSVSRKKKAKRTKWYTE